MALPLRKCSLISTIRIFAVFVSLIGTAAIIAALAFLTVTSMALIFIVTGVGIAFLAVSALAWRFTAYERSDEATTGPAIYMRSFRTIDCSFPYRLYSSPTAISSPLWSTMTRPHLIRCAPEMSPPPYRITDRSNASEIAPPVYTISDSLARCSSYSPPPRYTPQCLTVSTNPAGREWQAVRRSTVQIIDCSKAIPAMFQLDRVITSF
uniref:Uncharacterized protein n=1 Tax=Ascaris lumbricoides TaxID=6252 RepID=A0A9J2P405_ASCLU